jgi:hypothetical protein
MLGMQAHEPKRGAQLMKTRRENDAWGQALQELERNFETPVVPGELATWVSNLRASCDAVGPLLHAVVANAHAERIRQIEEQDPELLARAKQLREEDKRLLQEFEDVARRISTLDQMNADRVANQPQSEEILAELTESGLAFVIGVRTQEKAISTWHSEAFQRDRGLGD